MPWETTVRTVLRATGWAALRALPARRHVAVHGWPDSEGNSLETLRALCRRYPGDVVWLLNDEGYQPPAHVAADLTRVRRLRKDSSAGWRAAVTAEALFFTHGLYTAVQPPEDRLVVNLWHGDGPKKVRDTQLIRSTVAVAGTRLWGSARSERFDLPADAIAVVGNPRIDELLEPAPTAALEALDLDPDRPLVLWLPTYRSASGPRHREWDDAHALSEAGTVAGLVDAARDAGERLGVQVLLKPHPLDADRFDRLGIPVATSAQLDAAGVTLYQLLGHAAGVISDVSSVWTDFLSLDRPVAFYVPDLEEMKERRGFNVDHLERLLPGPRIVAPGDLTRFLAGVASADPSLRPSAFPGYAEIGPATAGGASDRLLDWLDDFQVRRGRRPLFVSAAAQEPGAVPASSQG